MQKTTPIFEFHKHVNIKDWTIVNDIVMGGKSEANFYINDEGHGVYKGTISLENNGGFSSVRYRFEPVDVTLFSKIILKVKGDGKRYQFRIKDKSSNKFAYITHFITSKEWLTVEFNLSDLYPTFKGRTLEQPNFDGSRIEEIAFLIANKKQESFQLEIDSIFLIE